jgi:cation diffusion facilitator CzcD-associated flavoprotein CzcO
VREPLTPSPIQAIDTLVIGAGPAGLATAAELARRGVPYRLVERGATLGHTWEHLYDSLTLHTGRHMSTLPGMRFARGTALFPTREQFLNYLRQYATRNSISVQTGAEVRRVVRTGSGWTATLVSGETLAASHLVMATGIVSNPRVPALAGRERFRGRVLHAVEYRRPGEFIGQRVLVVGVGNSGGEIGSELARAGAKVTVSVRSGAHVVPRQIGPVPAQYFRYLVGKLPRRAQEVVLGRIQARLQRRFGPPVLPRPSHSPLDAIPLIGFQLVDCIREGLVELKLAAPVAFTEDGVRFSDGTTGPYDAVLLATGYAPALAALGTQVQVDEKGFARRKDRVTSADQPGLWFVGHNYDHTGGITNIRRDAQIVAAAIAGQRASR